MKIADSLEDLEMRGTGGYLILIFFFKKSGAGGSLILTCFDLAG
jgi:hypothetical protein